MDDDTRMDLDTVVVLPTAMAARDPDRARGLLRQLTGGLQVVRGKEGLVAEGVLTGERLAAFGGLALIRGAGGET